MAAVRSLPYRAPTRYMPLVRLAAIAMVTLCGTFTATAQINGDATPDRPDTLVAAAVPLDPDLISFGLQFVPTPGSGSFFDRYTGLGGNVKRLDALTIPGVTMRLSTTQSLRVVISGGYASTTFTDIYSVRDTVSAQHGFASIVEDFSASAVPVLAGLEYSPVRTQFTTYAGVMAGLSYNNAEWQTTVREQTIGNFYRPGLNVHGQWFGPAFRLYVGSDLRFDRNEGTMGAVRGIFMEGSYFLVPLARDYFAAIRNQGRGSVGAPSESSGALNLGGLTFTFGINLQFVRR
ncbi:MAG: hypothetical protein JST22_03370 [Bacteroidetes bacterium]|nr:hypothetical protein [Bacteroidota bacterium]